MTLTVDTSALDKAIQRFFRDKGPEAARIGAAKIGFDVIAETQRAITAGSDGTPQRVDTGRLRGGWSAGARSAGLSGALAPVSGGTGYGSIGGSGLTVTVEIANTVEYAPFVEYGTVHMRAGNHLARAVEVVRRAIPGETGEGSIAETIATAWETA